ncbi:MFS transporter [Iodidimonas sp. SYSU 1G8]|uniref:spinster family MFS transporter n=1 Tax=Iodidimonas sp. SYSU 1G8 TaxID=3133967 RepID=UPI0031FEBD47
MQDSESVRPGEPPWPNPAYAWYVVIVLFIGAIVSFLDRQIIAIMVSDIKLDLGLSDFEIGLLQGPPFGIFYALMSIPIALAADQFNRRNIIAIGVTFWSLATAACGFAGHFWHLFLARISVGVGEATLSPSAYSIISDYFPKSKLAMAMSVFTMGNLTGVGLAMVLGSALLAALNAIGPTDLPLLGTMRPWQLAFVAVGLPGLLLALLVLTIREPYRRGRTVSDETQGGKAQLADFIAFLRSHSATFGHLLVSFTILVLIAYANFAWVVQFFVRSFGTTQTEAGMWYGTIVLIFGTMGAFFGGWLSNRLMRAGYVDAPFRASLICTLPLAVCAFFAFVVAPDSWWALVALAPCQFLGAVPAGLAGTAMMSITPNQMRAKAASVYLFFSNIVGISLGSTMVGFLTTHVFRDDSRLGHALAIINCGGAPIAALIIFLGMKHYRASLLHVEELTARQMQAAG